jgi:hypothetical protein
LGFLFLMKNITILMEQLLQIFLKFRCKQLYKFQYTFDNLKYDYFKIDGLKSNLYLQYVVSQNNFQDKFVIGWNDLL